MAFAVTLRRRSLYVGNDKLPGVLWIEIPGRLLNDRCRRCRGGCAMSHPPADSTDQKPNDGG
jgi:hypothetical protein